jgi:hypothetical protein
MALFEWPESDGRVRVTISTLVLLVLGTVTSSLDLRFCTPDVWARELSGGSADCGEFGASEDRSSAIDCMLLAQAQERPARAVFWENGIDSAIAHVFVRTESGSALMLAYDSSRSGGSFDPHLARRQCASFKEEWREMALDVRHSLECVEASASVDICGSE